VAEFLLILSFNYQISLQPNKL